jgi:hypothetical protein
MKDLTELEQAVICKLLEGDNNILATLREQASRARLVKRENTGAGFYGEFEVDEAAPTVRRDFHLGDVQGEISGLDHGAGFVLFIRGRRINMLEGYSYDEPRPDRVTNFSLKYEDPSRKEELAKLA